MYFLKWTVVSIKVYKLYILFNTEQTPHLISLTCFCECLNNIWWWNFWWTQSLSEPYTNKYVTFHMSCLSWKQLFDVIFGLCSCMEKIQTMTLHYIPMFPSFVWWKCNCLEVAVIYLCTTIWKHVDIFQQKKRCDVTADSNFGHLKNISM